ncbi:hypothetical protein KZ870_35360, partial [Pseudomonas aeruginosa]|nr:hypothetical protein [Pseudomonas aeruginosa]
MLKIYWAINTKNKNYMQSNGIEEYSASDIYNMVSKLLKNDGYKKVCKRTIERDMKLLNEMGLLQSKIRRLGKQKGSISHYRQNMELTHIHKDIILEYLKHLLKENLKDIKIIDDFNKELEDETLNDTNIEKFEIPYNLIKHNKITLMSHVKKSHVINKTNISYKNKENSKEMLSKKTVSNKQKTRQCKFKRQDVETRLISTHKISRNYIKQIKEHSNNNATYINALINLETAIIEYISEYNIEDILEHFIKQFSNKYKGKVWMMMRRKDGIISDYELIWERRFRIWYSNKYKCNYVPKKAYSNNMQVESKALNYKAKEKPKYLNLQKIEKIDKKIREKRKFGLNQREEYLKKLFECEVREREKRLKKAKQEQDSLKEQIKEDMIVILKKNKIDNFETNI